MEKFIYFFESLSIWVGRAFGWCIVVLTLSVTYEVFMRYVMNAPTVWVFDMMVQMYGALFLMAGAYALAQDAHVRGDVLYRLFPVRVQAWIDLILYISKSLMQSHSQTKLKTTYLGKKRRYKVLSLSTLGFELETTDILHHL